MATKKALLVGINEYKTPKHNLKSCVNDINKFSELLRSKYGFKSDDIYMVQDVYATLVNIQGCLEWLFKDAVRGDQIIFYFSGHGYQTIKEGVLRECLVMSDETFLFDDELIKYTDKIPPYILTVIIDSCHSGGMGDALLGNNLSDEQTRSKVWFQETGQQLTTFKADNKSLLYCQPFGQPVICTDFASNRPALSRRHEFLSDIPTSSQLNGLLLTACMQNELAKASTKHTESLSAFTFCFLRSIKDLGNLTSSKTLVLATKQKLHDIGLNQTPLLVEPAHSPGLSDLPFLTTQFAKPSNVQD
jgi:hypothetical protein